jgi:8-oxo-dGTP pyrophosphatase MutT (NUDIX family)
MPNSKRAAYFEAQACLYDPKTNQYTMFEGKCAGKITDKIVGTATEGLGYDSIFYYPPAKKTFAELPLAEKNLISHRGKIANQLRYYLDRHYSAKQILAVTSLIVKAGKFLLLKRRDHNPLLNNKWEFPGGGVETGESLEKTLLRETKEETGYKVKILEFLPTIPTVVRGQTNGNYQIFLITYLCQIVSGKFKTSAMETSGHGWFTLDEILSLKNMLPLNKKIVQANKQLLKKYID